MTVVQKAIRLTRRFATCSQVQRRLLVRSFLILQATTVMLRFMSLVSLQVALSRLARRAALARHDDKPPPDTVVWAVTAASRYTPRATCLARALASQVLLELYGFPSRLWVGIGRGSDGALGGHAWVEAGGVEEKPGDPPEGYHRLLLFTSSDHLGTTEAGD